MAAFRAPVPLGRRRGRWYVLCRIYSTFCHPSATSDIMFVLSCVYMWHYRYMVPADPPVSSWCPTEVGHRWRRPGLGSISRKTPPMILISTPSNNIILIDGLNSGLSALSEEKNLASFLPSFRLALTSHTISIPLPLLHPLTINDHFSPLICSWGFFRFRFL